MGYHLGVDLGTTFTAAAVRRGPYERPEAVTLGNRAVAVPSVVCLSDDEWLAGEAAELRATSQPSRVAREFKRRVGDPTPVLVGGTPVAAEQLMARLLAWVVSQVVETEGEPPSTLTVTHPANWGAYKLDLLRQAIGHLDIAVDHFVPEPIAAARFYASQRHIPSGSVVAIYDLGGGTFDAAVVSVEGGTYRIVGRPDGIERLGGMDFDHAVFGHVANVVGLDDDAEDPATLSAIAQLRRSCVEAKEALSSEANVSIPVMLPSQHTEVRLTRGELEAMIRPALRETLAALKRAIRSAEMAPADVSTVLLVGGSSRIPLISEMVTREIGRPVAVDARPKDTISLGATLLAPPPGAPEAVEIVTPRLDAMPPDAQRVRKRRDLRRLASVAAASVGALLLWLGVNAVDADGGNPEPPDVTTTAAPDGAGVADGADESATGLPPCSSERRLVVVDVIGLLTMGDFEALSRWSEQGIYPQARPGMSETVLAYRLRGYEILYVTTVPAGSDLGGVPVQDAITAWLTQKAFPIEEGARVWVMPSTAGVTPWAHLRDELQRLKAEGVSIDVGYTENSDKAYAIAEAGVPSERLFTLESLPVEGRREEDDPLNPLGPPTSPVPGDNFETHATAVSSGPSVCDPG